MSFGSNNYENRYLDYNMNDQQKEEQKKKIVILKRNKETLQIEIIGLMK